MALWAWDGRRRHRLRAVLAVSLIAAACGSKPPGAVTNDGAAGSSAGSGPGGSVGGGPGGSSGTAGGGPDGAANDARDVAPDDTRPDVPAAVDARTDGGADAGGGGPYPEAPGLCRAGWCWSNPLPQGNTIRSMCGRSPSDVWAVGLGATVLHWDGTLWSIVPTGLVAGTSHDLIDVWCSPGGSVWAVGDEAVLRLRNGTVTNVAPAGSDIWRFMSVGGTAEDDVWIGAMREIAYHWDGARLTQMFSGDASGGIYDVLARARNDVWFAGSKTTYHHDGLTIREEPLTPTVAGPWHFWWAPGDDLLADDYDAIYRWAEPARVWEMLPKPFSLQAGNSGGFMFGLSSRDLWWLFYSGSSLIHWDGTAWYFGPSTNTGWTSGYVAPSGELIVGGYNGRVGRLPPTPARVQDRVMEVHGRGYDVYDLTGIWASADGTAVHAVPGPYRLTSNGWERAPTSGTVSQSLNGIWGSSPTDVWAVGSYGAVAHFDGQTWSTVTTSLPSMETSTLYAISGTGPADVWAVGRNGMVGHYDGNSWTFAPRASLSDLYAVHAASPDDVWAVGKSGARQHYTIAGGWKLEPQYTSLELRGVFSAGANDVWVAGDSGYVLHWDGSAWSSTRISTNGPPKFMAMSGRAANDIWVAGQWGTLLHWSGTTWSDDSSLTSNHLNALWVGSAGDAWLAGQYGAILRRR